MSYIVSQVLSVPPVHGLQFYVYLISSGHKSKLVKAFEAKCDELGNLFGPRGAIVRPTTIASEEWGSQLTKAYFPGENPPDPPDPGLLITDAHPTQVTPETLRVFIPLENVEKHFGSIDGLITDLDRLVRKGDSSIFRKCQDRGSLLSTLNDILSLDVKLFGVGININAIIKKLEGRVNRT